MSRIARLVGCKFITSCSFVHSDLHVVHSLVRIKAIVELEGV